MACPLPLPMADPTAEPGSCPEISLAVNATDTSLRLSGPWNLRSLAAAPPEFHRTLETHAGKADFVWDLSAVEFLDSAGAFVLWQVWGERLPAQCRLRPEHVSIFERWQNRTIPVLHSTMRPATAFPVRVQRLWLNGIDHVLDFVTMLGQFALDLAHLLRHPQDLPLREISATVHETGGRAIAITALVGFLIGVVVSYLSSFQLQTFGAQIYIVNILGLSIIRELGPLLAAILVAGRSGSAMTARIGVMRVTQELDALAAMGISHSLRLVLPKVVALTIAMPMLIVWTDIIALAGGATSARLELGISFHQFLDKLPSAVPVENFALGLGKGVMFGLFIALLACHFGLRIQPNTESIGNETTNSVVASITLVILVDAVFAILFRGVGLP